MQVAFGSKAFDSFIRCILRYKLDNNTDKPILYYLFVYKKRLPPQTVSPIYTVSATSSRIVPFFAKLICHESAFSNTCGV